MAPCSHSRGEEWKLYRLAGFAVEGGGGAGQAVPQSRTHTFQSIQFVPLLALGLLWTRVWGLCFMFSVPHQETVS